MKEQISIGFTLAKTSNTDTISVCFTLHIRTKTLSNLSTARNFKLDWGGA